MRGGVIFDYFAAGWVDDCSFAVALFYAFLRYLKRPKKKRKLLSQETGLDAIHGLAIFPLLLLMVAVFSSMALDAILHAHKVILGAAAFVALCSIFDND